MSIWMGPVQSPIIDSAKGKIGGNGETELYDVILLCCQMMESSTLDRNMMNMLVAQSLSYSTTIFMLYATVQALFTRLLLEDYHMIHDLFTLQPTFICQHPAQSKRNTPRKSGLNIICVLVLQVERVHYLFVLFSVVVVVIVIIAIAEAYF